MKIFRRLRGQRHVVFFEWHHDIRLLQSDPMFTGAEYREVLLQPPYPQTWRIYDIPKK